MAQKTFNDAILWFFLAIFLGSLFLLGKLLWPFVSIIVVGTVVTGIFTPIYNLLRTSERISNPLASALTCLLVFVVLFIPIVLFVGILSKEAYDLYLTAREAAFTDKIRELLAGSSMVDKINAWLVNFNFQLTGDELNRALSEVGKTVGLYLYDQARSIATNTLVFLANFFLMLLVVYYLLIDGERLVSFITDLSPLPEEQDRKLLLKFKDMSAAVLIGNGLGGLIQGIAGGSIFYLFELKSPFLWGVIMGLLAFLPILGIGLVLIPTALYLVLFKGQLGAAVFLIIFYITLSGGIEYVFKPKLVGTRAKMHTLLVFLAIIGGLKLFGILGIIYGPLTVTAFLTLNEIYRTSYQQIVDPEHERRNSC